MLAKCTYSIILFISLSLYTVSAQQESLYTQYVYNELTINPAYAGYHNALNISLNSRKQWVGLEGSPFTNTIALHTALNEKNSGYKNFTSRQSRMQHRKNQNTTGLGFLVYNDRIGVTNTLQTNLSYSHKIVFNSGRLSFGLQSSLINYTQNYNNLDKYNTEDPVFNSNFQKNMINFGTGVFFDSDRYYLGFSVPQIIENNIDDVDNEKQKQIRQYFFTGGYLFYLNKYYKFKPSMMFRYAAEIPYQIDFSGMIIYRDKIFAGLSYRNKDTFSSIFQFSYNNRLRIGLAYDYIWGKLKMASNGSVEIMINYSFLNRSHKIVNPKYF